MLADTPFLPMETPDQLEEALARSAHEPVVLFKHSTACPISGSAHRSLSQLSEDTDPPVYRLIVQSARGLSNDLAATFGIRHESPQAIVLYQRKAVFDASHGRVSAATLREAVRAATAQAV